MRDGLIGQRERAGKNDDNGGKCNISIDICLFPLYMTDELILQSAVNATPAN